MNPHIRKKWIEIYTGILINVVIVATAFYRGKLCNIIIYYHDSECPSINAMELIACKPGYFSVGNQSSCSRCPPGYECPNQNLDTM